MSNLQIEKYSDAVDSRSVASSRRIVDSRQVKVLSSLVFLFLACNVALDFAAGLLGADSISQLSRALFFVLLLYVELLLDREGFCILLVGLAFIVAQSAITQMLSQQGSLTVASYMYDVSIGVKFLMFFAVYSAIKSLSEVGAFPLEKVERAFGIAAVYVPILYLGSFVLGIGQASYWDGSGFKSVFSSLNSVNISILVLFVYSIDALFAKKRRVWLVAMLLNLASIVLMGTKSSYFFAATVFLYYLLIPKGHRVRNLVVGLVAILAVYLIASNSLSIMESISAVYERQSYLFESRSFIDYLTSGRTWMLGLATSLFVQQDSPFALILGGGYYSFHHALSVASGYLSTNAVRPIEFDWADVLFAYGLPIALLVYCFLLSKLAVCMADIERRRFFFVSLIVMLIFSCMGGHVLFEAISSVTLGGVLAGGVVVNRSDGEVALEKWHARKAASFER